MSYLGIDIGTSGCKAVVFDAAGHPLGAARREYTVCAPGPDRAELDSSEVIASCRDVVRETAASARSDPVRALAISSQGEAFTPVDAEGRHLGNAMVSSDTRALPLVDSFVRAFGRDRLYRITGHSPSPLFSLFKLLWLKQHEPDTWNRAAGFYCFEDLLHLHLGIEPAMGWPLAGRTMLFDVRNHCWSPDILATLSLRANRLARPLASGGVAGTVPSETAAAWGLPPGVTVVAGGHDQTVAALGAGVVEPGDAMLATGTVECICPLLPELTLNRDLCRLNLCCYDAAMEGCRTSVAYSLTGGNLLAYFRDQFGGGRSYDELLDEMPDRPTDLMVLPYFTASGTPFFDSITPATVMGWRLGTTRGELLKGLLEGVLLEMKLNLSLMESAGMRIERLVATGGGARNEHLIQLKADVLNKPIMRTDVAEAGCRGAALLAQCADSNVSVSQLARRDARREIRILPRAAHAERYQEKFARYRRFYPAVKRCWGDVNFWRGGHRSCRIARDWRGGLSVTPSRPRGFGRFGLFTVLLLLSTVFSASRLPAAGLPAPLTREAAWADPNAETVFTERFENPAAQGLRVLAPGNTLIHAGGVVPGAGPDGGHAYVLDLDLPVGVTLQVAMEMPETDPRGLTYRFHLKFETDPPAPPGEQYLRLEMNRAGVSDAIYYAEALEYPEVRDGAWMDRVTRTVFRAHAEYVYRGWTRYEGNTASSFLRRYDGRRIGEPLSRWLHMNLRNLTDEPLRVRISLADITVIRRDIDNLPAMKALIEAPRPVIRHTREQILRARRRVEDGMRLPRDIAADLHRAGQWLEEAIVVPQKQAAWPGARQCRADSCDGRLQPAPPEGFKCPVCDKLHTGEPYDGLLVHHRHRLNGQAVRALGLAWQWTDDERYARKAEEILLAYAEVIENFRLGHNWLGDCWLMEDFIFGFDTIDEWVTPESRATIVHDFLMLMARRIHHYNHHYPEGYIRLARVCTWSALLARDVDWLYYLVLSPTGNREVTFRYGLTADGISMKGPAYHGDIMRGMNAIGQTIENGGVTFFDDRVRRMYDAIPQQLFPDNSLPAFGHANVGYGAAAYGMDVAYRYYRDPLFLALTSQGFRDDPSARIFWDDPELPPVEPLSLPSTHLLALGLTMLRTADNAGVLALSWGAPQRNDPARLDFQYFGAGGHLIWSSGITGYANPFYNRWYQTSLSRNGLVIDEQTQAPRSGTILLLDTDRPNQVVAAELSDAYPDTRWLRVAILFADGDALLFDRLVSPTPRTVDWVCHLPGTVETTLELIDVVSPFGKANGYDVLTEIRGGDAAEPFSMVLNSTRAQPGKVRGVRVSPAPVPDGRFYIGQGRTGTSAVLSPVGLIRRENVVNTIFAVLFEPFTGEPREPGSIRVVDADANHARIEVRRGERIWHIDISENRDQPAGEADRLRVDVTAQ